MTLNVKEARRNFKALLDRVEAGEEVLLLRRGKPVARLVPPRNEEAAERGLPRLGAFRDSVARAGRALSEDILAARGEERY